MGGEGRGENPAGAVSPAGGFRGRNNEQPPSLRGWTEKAAAALLTVSVQMGDRGVSVLGGDIRVPQEAVQNKHSQPRDVAVVFQSDELPKHRLEGNESRSQDRHLCGAPGLDGKADGPLRSKGRPRSPS